MPRHWFCTVTKPQQEARAAVELTKQDFRAYLPILYGKPLFPRYLFVEFDRDVDDWGKIRSTRGCCDLLKTGFLPTIVPQFAMDAIMAFRPPQEPQDARIEFRLGDSVRVASGLLQGCEGLFLGTDKQRVRAFLEIMGRRVEIPLKDVAGAA